MRAALIDHRADGAGIDIIKPAADQRKALGGEVDHFFSAWGLTLLQFNVLRILYVRDPDRNGISRGDIEAKLIRRVPDVTRLLDRLEGAGMIERIRPGTDRRTVLSRLTEKGVALVEDTHQPLLALNRKQFAHMTREVPNRGPAARPD